MSAHLNTDEAELIARLRERRWPGKWSDTVVSDPLCLEAADAISRIAEEREEAQAAENEAKDCFWAVYPVYVEATGHGISTEAARTELAERVTASQAEVERLREALSQHERLLMVNAVRAAAQQAAPLWLEAADNAASRVRGGAP